MAHDRCFSDGKQYESSGLADHQRRQQISRSNLQKSDKAQCADSIRMGDDSDDHETLARAYETLERANRTLDQQQCDPVDGVAPRPVADYRAARPPRR